MADITLSSNYLIINDEKIYLVIKLDKPLEAKTPEITLGMRPLKYLPCKYSTSGEIVEVCVTLLKPPKGGE